MKSHKSQEKYISLKQAAKLCNYSQDYLSLRARQGKLKAIKLGRNWVTTQEWLNKYKEANQYLSLSKAAQKIPYSADYLALRIRQKKLRAVKIKGKWMVKEEWLNSYLQNSFKTKPTIDLSKGLSLIGSVLFGLKQRFLAINKKIENNRENLSVKIDQFYNTFFQTIKKSRFIGVLILVFCLLGASAFAAIPQARSLATAALNGSAEFVYQQSVKVKESSGWAFNQANEFIAETPEHIQQISDLIDFSLKNLVLDAVFVTENSIIKLKQEIKTISNLAIMPEMPNFDLPDYSIQGFLNKFNQLSQKNEELKSDFRQKIAFIPLGINKLADNSIDYFIHLPDFDEYTHNQIRLIQHKLARNLNKLEQMVFNSAIQLAELPDFIKDKSTKLVSLPDLVFSTYQETVKNLNNEFISLSELRSKFVIYLSDISSSLSDIPNNLSDIVQKSLKKAEKLVFILNDKFNQLNYQIINNLAELPDFNTQVNDSLASVFGYFQEKASSFRSTLGDAYLKLADYLIPGLNDEESYLIGRKTIKTQESVVQEVVPKIITKEVVKVKQVETQQQTKVSKVVETIESNQVVSIRSELGSLSERIINLGSQINNKVDFTVPAHKPVYIPSSGIEVSGHSMLSTLNVSGSGTIKESLGVGKNFSAGDSTDANTTFNVYSIATFNEAVTFEDSLTANQGLTINGKDLTVAKNASISGTLSAATTTLDNLTINNDLLVSGNATTTGSQAFSSTVSIADKLTATSTQIIATTTDTLLTLQQNSTGDILKLQDNQTDVFTITENGNLIMNASSTLPIINLTASSTNTHLDLKLSGAGDLLNIKDKTDSSKLYLTNQGNFGINTSTPGGYYNELFTVNGDSYFKGNATTTGSRHIDGDLSVIGAFSHSGATASFATTTITGDLTVQDSDGNKHLYLQNNSGNLGIGDLSPSARLTSSSTLEQLRLIYDQTNNKYASFTIDSNGDLTIDLATANATTTINDNFKVTGNATTTGSSYIGGDLITDGTGSFASASLTIDSSGNLTTTGYASTTTGLFTQGDFHSGGNANIDGTLNNLGLITGSGGLTIDSGDILFSTSGIINQSGSGQVTFSGNLDADSGLDVSGGNLTATTTVITVQDSTSAALTVQQDSSGNIVDFKDGVSSVLTIADGGAITINGDINQTGELDVSGYGQFNNVTTTDTLAIGGYATSTGGFYTKADIHAGGNLTVDGNVGIGIDNPLRPLSFNDILGEKLSLFSLSNTARDYYGFGVSSGAMEYQVPAASYHLFYVGDSIKFKIGDGGNVGINDLSPDARLTSSSTNEQLRLIHDQVNSKYASFTVDSNGDLTIDLATANATTTINDNFKVLGDTKLQGNATTTGSLNIDQDLTVDGTALFANTALSIDSSGNLTTTGYATTTGGLYTQSNIHAGGNLTVDGNATISGGSSFSGDLDMNSYKIVNIGDSGTDFNDSGGLTLAGNLQVNGSATTTGSFYFPSGVVQENGNVGIGTTNPTSTLQVVGDFHASGDNGEEGLYWDASDGNVGIGTTNPTQLLTLSASIPKFRIIDEDSSTGYMDMRGANAGFVFDLDPLNNVANSQIKFDIDGSNVMFLEEDGNVGIGTTTPKQLLTLDGGGLCIDDGTGVCGSQSIASGNLYTKSATTTGSFYFAGNGVIKEDGNVGIGTTTINERLSIEGSGGDILGLYDDSGTSKLVVQNGGNLGIGTTGPGAKLEVNGSDTHNFLTLIGSGAEDAIKILDTTNNKYLEVGHGDNYAIFNIDSGTNAYWFNTDDDTKVAIQQDGNLGIGTTEPGAKLDIDDGENYWGTSNAPAQVIQNQRPAIVLYDDSDPSSSTNIRGIWNDEGKLRFERSGYTSNDYGYDEKVTDMVINNNGNLGIGTTTINERLSIEGSGGDILGLYDGSGTSKVTVQNDGNVGIGTTSPEANLQIYGDETDAQLLIGEGKDIARGFLINKDGASPYDANIYWSHHPTTETGDLHFHSSQDSGEIVTFKADGNVGIGTTEPGTQLHLSGTTGMTISDLGGTDDTNILQIGEGTNYDEFQLVGNFAGDGDSGNNLELKTDLGGGTIMSWRGDGNVGIGTTTINERLSIEGSGGDILGLYDGSGTSKLVVQNDGNVGIGTTDPSSELDVSGTIPELTLTNDVTGSWDFGDIYGQLSFYSGDNDYYAPGVGAYIRASHLRSGTGHSASDMGLEFGVNAGDWDNPPSTAMVIATDGNVGIGTTSPGELLTLEKSEDPAVSITRSGNELVRLGDVGSGGSDGGELLLKNSAGTLQTLLSGTRDSYIQGGNVGIGTTGPNQLFEIRQATPYLRISDSTSGSWDNGDIFGGIEFYTEDSNTTGVNAAIKAVHLRDGTGHSYSDSGLVFYTSDPTDEPGATGPVARMVIDNDGNVGIGTTGPNYQLELSTDSAGKPTSNTWTIVSDERLKKDINDFTDGLSVLKQINPVNYTLNGLGGTPEGAQGIGVIAQDMIGVAPYTIETFNAKLYPDDATTTELYSFDSSALTFVAINAIKEIAQRIDLTQAPTSSPSLTLTKNGYIGIATTTPTNILTIGQGQGNAIADGWDVYSSEEYKTEISYLEESDYNEILTEIEGLDTATYVWKTASSTVKRNFGVIAEQAPERVLSENGKSVSLYDYATFAIAGVKALNNKVNDLEVRIDNLSGTMEDTSQTSQIQSDTITLINNQGEQAQLVLDEQGYVVIDKLKVGELEIAQGGQMTMPEGENQILGNGSILAGQDSVIIENTKIASSSKIFVSFTSNLSGASYWVCDKQAGELFEVCLSQQAEQELAFDYWIVQARDLTQTETLSTQATTSLQRFYQDFDQDGYGSWSSYIEATSTPSGYVANKLDCNDTDASINPDAEEICDDGIDNNCDLITDDCILEQATSTNEFISDQTATSTATSTE